MAQRISASVVYDALIKAGVQQEQLQKLGFEERPVGLSIKSECIGPKHKPVWKCSQTEHFRAIIVRADMSADWPMWSISTDGTIKKGGKVICLTESSDGATCQSSDVNLGLLFYHTAFGLKEEARTLLPDHTVAQIESARVFITGSKRTS